MRYTFPIMLVVYLLWLMAAQAGQDANPGGPLDEIVARRLIIRDSKGEERITLGVNESASGKGDAAVISFLNKDEDSVLLVIASGDGSVAQFLLGSAISQQYVGVNENGSGVLANTMLNGESVVSTCLMVKGSEEQESDLGSTGPNLNIHDNDALAKRGSPGVGFRLRRDGSTKVVGF